MKLPPVDRFGSDNPSDVQRAPSDYARENGVRGPSIRIGFQRINAPGTPLHNHAYRFFHVGEKREGEPDMMRVMGVYHNWYPLEPEAIALPAGYMLHPETGHGIRIDEVNDHDGFWIKPAPTTLTTEVQAA